MAGSPASESVPKWCASSGAVAAVAATVIASPSARARGRPGSASRTGGASTRIPATAANESCQPGSAVARGLNASVAQAASRSAYQREAGLAAASATREAAPITPARCRDGPAPASGTYTAISATVTAIRPAAAIPAAASNGSDSAASSITF